MPVPTPDQINLVQTLLPTAASDTTANGGYGWDAIYITTLMVDRDFTPTQAVRWFWLQRVNETSEYLDIGGKPLSQIHASARSMLDYWDEVLKIRGKYALGPGDKRPLSFGEIDKPESYERIERWYHQV